MTAEPSVACVVVTFQSNDVLGECLESIPQKCTVIVVDQPTTEDPRPVIAKHRPGARIVRPVANRGFGAGCNAGAALVDADVIIFLNPDAQLSAGALEILCSEVLEHGGTLVGPRILGADGSDKTCARRFSTIGRDLAELVLPRPLRPAFLDKEVSLRSVVYATGGEVDYVQGACMAVGERVFRSTGGFSEEMFLYGEEEWLALGLAEGEGLKPRVAPRAVVRHSGHHSTDRVATFAVEQFFRSRAFIYRARYGRLTAWLGIALNAAALGALLATHRVRRPLRFRPVEDAVWCRSALRGLASGSLRRVVQPPGTVPAGHRGRKRRSEASARRLYRNPPS